MRESGTKTERIAIPYFDGVNSTVQQVIARKSELSHAENARAPMIGVLEKRQGQIAIGTNTSGGTFMSFGDYGVTYHTDNGTLSQGLMRVSTIDNSTASIYYLDQANKWNVVNNQLAIGLSKVLCNFAKVDNSLIVVNGTDANRMITGSIANPTVMSSSSTLGSLYNSPRAKNVAFYKSRIYLADYYKADGTELKTTVLRSSYPLGIIALLNADVSTAVSNQWILPVTDTKYFYTFPGMNAYEIYRGNLKIATISINAFTEISISAPSSNVVFESGYSTFLSSDEVWVNGTFAGDKQYRWITNSSSTGRDVKQYDTFKLVGGDEDAITLLEPIGNILMISNKNALMTWNDYILENFDIGVGCCSKNGYVKLKGALYFLHYSGIFSTSGSAPVLISRKVDRYIKGATKAGLEACAAGFKGLSIFFTIGDSTLYKNDGSLWKVLPQVCLEFNIADQNWYVHTNVTATQFETYMQTNGQERLTMCSTSPAQNAILGDELITNGGFSGNSSGWERGAGWSYSANQVTFTAP